MIQWLTIKSIMGLPRWGWLLIVAVLIGAGIFAAVRVADNAVEDVIETAKEAGATEQRAGDLAETIERTEKGNEARDDIRADRGTARYDQCVRTARTPANCQRFLPEQ